MPIKKMYFLAKNAVAFSMNMYKSGKTESEVFQSWTINL